MFNNLATLGFKSIIVEWMLVNLKNGLTWGCRSWVFSSLRGEDHRSDGQMLLDRRLLTAPLSAFVFASHLKPPLSSEQPVGNKRCKGTPREPTWLFQYQGGESGSKVHLSRIPVCQCAKMCQYSHVSEAAVLQLSVPHLCHQWAQRQHLIRPQLPHRAEELDLMKRHPQICFQITS